MRKKKLLVTFSGGETSAYMAYWLKQNKSEEYEFYFVFANVGEEMEETLEFVDKCDKYFNLGVIWVEPVIHMQKGVGTTHRIVNFKNAERSGIGGSFEDMVMKYGIPNMSNPICTRELKERPITSYMRSIGLKAKDYETAIGIRVDEIDRISKNKDKNKIIYPFIEFKGVTKKMVNEFWKGMPFRLGITGYQGNCKWCWKKSFRKLGTLVLEDETNFDFPVYAEWKYGRYCPPGKDEEKWSRRYPISFFRGRKNVNNIFDIPNKEGFTPADDDHQLFDEIDNESGCIGSCEPFHE